MPGKVKVKIVAGRNLPVMDRSNDTTDAYVEVKLGSTTFKTEVCRKSLNPQWDSEWFRFEMDDLELQDEPLQIRLMDHDTYSANDAIGKVYLDLNPLLLTSSKSKDVSHGGKLISGWIPVYDTMHGIRGEVNLIVKVELFSDLNKFRQSSCGVKFFFTQAVPDGHFAHSIHGFVEELVVNDDPEYQWIDKIRTPRASNEARQTLFSKLSGEVQRRVGLKALELGGNAVIGYRQCFDLEGESGIVVRGIGTAATLTQCESQLSPSTGDMCQSVDDQLLLKPFSSHPSRLSKSCRSKRTGSRVPTSTHSMPDTTKLLHHDISCNSASSCSLSSTNCLKPHSSPNCMPYLLHESSLPVLCFNNSPSSFLSGTYKLKQDYYLKAPPQQLHGASEFLTCELTPVNAGNLQTEINTSHNKQIDISKINEKTSNNSNDDDDIVERKPAFQLYDSTIKTRNSSGSAEIENVVSAERETYISGERVKFQTGAESLSSLSGVETDDNNKAHTNSVIDLAVQGNNQIQDTPGLSPTVNTIDNKSKNLAVTTKGNNTTTYINTNVALLVPRKPRGSKKKDKYSKTSLLKRASMNFADSKKVAAGSGTNHNDTKGKDKFTNATNEIVKFFKKKKSSVMGFDSDNNSKDDEDDGETVSLDSCGGESNEKHGSQYRKPKSSIFRRRQKFHHATLQRCNSADFSLDDTSLDSLPSIQSELVFDAGDDTDSNSFESLPRNSQSSPIHCNIELLMDDDSDNKSSNVTVNNPPPVSVGSVGSGTTEPPSLPSSPSPNSVLKATTTSMNLALIAGNTINDMDTNSNNGQVGSWTTDKSLYSSNTLIAADEKTTSLVVEAIKELYDTDQALNLYISSQDALLVYKPPDERNPSSSSCCTNKKPETTTTDTTNNSNTHQSSSMDNNNQLAQGINPLLSGNISSHHHILLKQHKIDISTNSDEMNMINASNNFSGRNINYQNNTIVEENTNVIEPSSSSSYSASRFSAVDSTASITSTGSNMTTTAHSSSSSSSGFGYVNSDSSFSMINYSPPYSPYLSFSGQVKNQIARGPLAGFYSSQQKQQQQIQMLPQNSNSSSNSSSFISNRFAISSRSCNSNNNNNNNNNNRNNEKNNTDNNLTHYYHHNRSLSDSSHRRGTNTSTNIYLQKISKESKEQTSEVEKHESATMKQTTATTAAYALVGLNNTDKLLCIGVGNNSSVHAHIPCPEESFEKKSSPNNSLTSSTTNTTTITTSFTNSPTTTTTVTNAIVNVSLSSVTNASSINTSPAPVASTTNTITTSNTSATSTVQSTQNNNNGVSSSSSSMGLNSRQINTSSHIPSAANTGTGAPHKLTSSSPAKVSTTTVSFINRRSSESDLCIAPKLINTTATTVTTVMASSSHGKTLTFAPVPNRRYADHFEMLEYPFITLSHLPPGFIKHLGGTVSARSVKLLERISNLDEPESRDSWWNEIRMEIRSHARAIGCNVVLGYEEHTTMCDDVCVLSASGTAAIVSATGGNDSIEIPVKVQASENLPTARGVDKERSHARTDSTSSQQNGYVKGGPKLRHCSSENAESPCSMCHIPYNESSVPFPVKMTRCLLCKKGKVPDILLATVDLPPSVQTYGKSCLIQAQVYRPKRDCKGEVSAKEVSDSLPFLEYELHRRLINKLKVRGMNAIFALQVQICLGEKLMVGLATGTAVFISCLPPPSLPKITAGSKSTDSQKVIQFQKVVQEVYEKNREIYNLKNIPPLQTGENGSQLGGSDDELSEEDLPDIDLATGNKDTYVLEVDDAEDIDIIQVLIDQSPELGFYMNNINFIHGFDNCKVVSQQMFTQVWRCRISPLISLRQFTNYFDKLLQAVAFKLRRISPCVLSRLRYRVELPEQDEMQLLLYGLAVRLEDKVKNGTPEILSHNDAKNNEVESANDNGVLVPQMTNVSSSASTTTSTAVDSHLSPAPNSSSNVSRSGSGNANSNNVGGFPSIKTSTKVQRNRPKCIEITPLSHIPGRKIEKYLGNLNFFFIRETTSIRESGGLSGFVHNFVAEVLAIVRAHVSALGGNAMVSYFMTELALLHNPHKNQGQCLVNVGGDVCIVASPNSAQEGISGLASI